MTKEKPAYKLRIRDFVPFGFGAVKYAKRVTKPENAGDFNEDHFYKCMPRIYALGVYNGIWAAATFAAIGFGIVKAIKGLEALLN